MSSFDRTDKTLLGRWWWTVDRLTLVCVVALIAFGVLLTMSGSPSVADRLNLGSFYFARRQLIMLIPTFSIIFIVSLMTPMQVKKISFLGLLASIFMLTLVPYLGYEIKGARRWLNFFGMSIQPSEFVKPCLCVVCAWFFSLPYESVKYFGKVASAISYVTVVFLLLLQPDLGMVVIVTLVWAIQFFLAGLPIFFTIVFGLTGVVSFVGAYFLFPHVSDRVNRFLQSSGDKYDDQFQILQSLSAFKNGGAFGLGPGEGMVKRHLPDAHADFVFAVAGEEFGLFVCLLIVTMFIFVFIRTFIRLNQEKNLFIILSAAGLVSQVTLQAIINMSSNLRLIPTKGMTLPFISYGGSSILALGLTVGMLLSLTRKRYEWEKYNV